MKLFELILPPGRSPPGEVQYSFRRADAPLDAAPLAFPKLLFPKKHCSDLSQSAAWLYQRKRFPGSSREIIGCQLRWAEVSCPLSSVNGDSILPPPRRALLLCAFRRPTAMREVWTSPSQTLAAARKYP